MKAFITVVLIFIFQTVYPQFSDNFSDGDYTSNPTWTATSGDWIVNPAFELQSNNTTASSTFWITTPNTLATVAQWDFTTRLAFNPSGANYVDVFLTSSAQDLSATSTTGYFVRLGNTDDEISLYRKDATGIVKIIDGANGTFGSSSNTVHVRVTRDASDKWILYRDLTGGNNLNSEGNVTDATYTASQFFGILVKQSTASFFQRHFFDDIVVQPYVPDVTAPSVVSTTATTASTLDVLFNEPVDITSAQTLTNYSVNNGIGFPSSAIVDASNSSLVHLTFLGVFPNRQTLTLTVTGVQDLSGNAIGSVTSDFAWFTAIAYDVLIDEIMADPTPEVGLPNSEWIELRNTTQFDINLQGWKIGKGSSLSGAMPSFILEPDSFVIVTTGSAVPALSVFGDVISVTSFPSLSNEGDLIYLVSPEGITIHAVNYSDTWYKNELKKEGGWSLELIDSHNPCQGASNWTASIDPSGGTPGRKNSVDAANPDVTSPSLLRAYAPAPNEIVLVFSESVDVLSASVTSNYSINNGIGTPVTTIPEGPLFTTVRLTLPADLQPSVIYNVSASNISDCAGNMIGPANTVRVGLFSAIDSFDIVVNEILFDPKSGGVDYVELYNRSNKILNLKNAYLANRGSSGDIASITQVSSEDYLLFPGDFVVLTTDISLVLRDYVAQNPSAFIEMSSMPSFPDDEGFVIVLNQQGTIVDEVDYSDDWHFPLITNPEGVSLERIDYDAPSNTSQNWHSAAATVNFGTPTYKNSQYRLSETVQGEIKISPEVFSPDNDGFDDFLTIDYSFPQSGYVANITIFDAAGRPVRYLQRNSLAAVRGTYRWDGTGEKNEKLPTGMYIIYTEIFNLEGKTKKFKNVVVLARKR